MKGCRPLTEKEVNELLQSFHGTFANRDKALFVLGLKSGFRISELLSLRLGDIMQAGKLVDHVKVRRSNMKKKLEGRSVLLHPEAKEALGVWISELMLFGYNKPNSFVFQSRQGKDSPISRMHAWRILRTIYNEAELTGQLGTHSLRKTFADRVYNKLDKDLPMLQRALGHRNINSTVSYLSFAQEEVDQAILSA